MHDEDEDEDYCFILLLLFIRTRRRRRNTFSELLIWYIEHAHNNNTPDLEERRNTLSRELQNSLYIIGKPSSSARVDMALKGKKK